MTEAELALFLLIAKVAMGTTLFTFAIGLWKIRSLTRELKLLLTLTGVSFACDFLAKNHASLGINPNYVGLAWRIVEFYFLLIIYHWALDNPRNTKWFVLLGACYLVFGVVNVAFIQQAALNSYTHVLSAALFIVLSVLYFFKLIKELPTLKVYRLSMFWVNVGVLFYFSGNIFLWTLYYYMTTVLHDNMAYNWSFHNSVMICKNLLFAMAFFVSGRQDEVTEE